MENTNMRNICERNKNENVTAVTDPVSRQQECIWLTQARQLLMLLIAAISLSTKI